MLRRTFWETGDNSEILISVMSLGIMEDNSEQPIKTGAEAECLMDVLEISIFRHMRHSGSV